MYYNKFSQYLRERYGERVWKINVDAGYSCPNRNIVSGKEGCIFCRIDSFSKRPSLQKIDVTQQISERIRGAQDRGSAKKFIVYFQASTNTYAPIEILRRHFEEALDFDGIVGLSIATRPDCLDAPVLDLISELADKTDVWIELGLQSVHDKTLKLLNRGHSYDDYLQALEKLIPLPLRICTHLILGLPGENRDQIFMTAREVSRSPIHEIKIHPLLILKDTPAAKLYEHLEIQPLQLKEYINLVCDFLERLRETLIIQRLTAEAPSAMLLAPRWTLNKQAILKGIESEFERRTTRQGVFFTPPQIGI
jgi:uncharacterized protein